MGGALLQQLNRDTQRFAMKCSAVLIDGLWVDAFKDPITDPDKASKRGRLSLFRHKETGRYLTARLKSRKGWEDNVPEVEDVYDWDEVLFDVWNQGVLLKDWTFQEVRQRSLSTL